MYTHLFFTNVIIFFSFLSVIRLNVIGHFRETLIAVCSTPSSPFNEFGATLLKFLLTEKRKEKKIITFVKNKWVYM
jgi:hypothetical protein